ncbi:MAG: GAF domain-containing protein [Thermaerobacter sp.]|nr:GAF domain-containing protein [Thermaerobacter sp.]
MAQVVLDVEEAPWSSRLQGVCAVLWQARPSLVSASLYAPDPPGIRLVLAAHQGGPVALTVPWHEGLVGTAAADRVVQIVPLLRMFHGHRLDNPAAQSAVAVPVTRPGVLAVLVLLAPERDAFTPVEVEMVQQVAEQAAQRWPSQGH